MRLKQLVMATLFGAVVALPAFAQTPAAPAPMAPAKPAVTAPAKPTVAAKAPIGPVNVNTASAAELIKLRGIGKSRSAAIIKGRPYKSVDEIDTKKVIPHATFEKIKAQLTV